MKKRFAIILAFALTTPLVCVGVESDRDATQASLDADCEAARQLALAPEHDELVAQCVEKKQKDDRESCERFYRDYGERSGHASALYYNLKECVTALEYRQSYQ